jgi:hypothetical protein
MSLLGVMAESFRGFPASRNLGVPKLILIEEIFSSMKNRQLLEGDLASIKAIREPRSGSGSASESGFATARL